ncbi:BTAD domain-containing putative transcriptional regulator [Geodermatophilus sp. SYSU D00691]
MRYQAAPHPVAPASLGVHRPGAVRPRATPPPARPPPAPGGPPGRRRRPAAGAEALVAEHPLRERPWVQLVDALVAAGRTADALARGDRAGAGPPGGGAAGAG